jgi:hypothetical protein
MNQFIAAIVAFFTGRPSAYANLAKARVNAVKANVADARALLIAEEQRAVAVTEKTIARLANVATAATESEAEAEADRKEELSTFDSTTDRRIAALEQRLRALKARRATLRTKLNSKLESERADAVRENNAINAELAALALELVGLVEQQDVDEAIAESLSTDGE